jgi:hypothetical protein
MKVFSLSYSLSVQPRDASRRITRAIVESVVAGLPGVQMSRFGHPLGRSFLYISLEGETYIEKSQIFVAAHNRRGVAPLALLLGFRIAERLDWELYDPQSDNCYGKETLDDVLKDQQSYGKTMDEILTKRSNWNLEFGELFQSYLRYHPSGVIIFALLSTLIMPFVLIVMLSLPAKSLTGLGLAVLWGLLVFTTSAALQALLHRKRIV